MQPVRTILIAALLLAVAGCAQPAAAPAPVDLVAVETEVRDLVLRYNADYADNDLDPYFSVYDPNLTQWWSTGRENLQNYEKYWRQLVADGGGISKAVVSDLRIQISPDGNAAVATYVLEVTPRRDGQPLDRAERNQETDVLFRENGAWKVVHVNYRSAPDAEPAG